MDEKERGGGRSGRDERREERKRETGREEEKERRGVRGGGVKGKIRGEYRERRVSNDCYNKTMPHPLCIGYIWTICRFIVNSRFQKRAGTCCKTKAHRHVNTTSK